MAVQLYDSAAVWLAVLPYCQTAVVCTGKLDYEHFRFIYLFIFVILLYFLYLFSIFIFLFYSFFSVYFFYFFYFTLFHFILFICFYLSFFKTRERYEVMIEEARMMIISDDFINLQVK